MAFELTRSYFSALGPLQGLPVGCVGPYRVAYFEEGKLFQRTRRYQRHCARSHSLHGTRTYYTSKISISQVR